MKFLLIITIAISLSMDAFSLSVAYGTLNLGKKEINRLAIVVGCYHFFMPLLGTLVGDLILKFLPLSPNTVVLVVLSIIGFQMICESFHDKILEKNTTLIECLLFGFAVSVDSFSVGIGLNSISENHLLCSSIFALSALVFTYYGLMLGKKINSMIGKISTLIGGVVLIIIGIMYFFNM